MREGFEKGRKDPLSTRLQYFSARYFMSSLGRFTSPDPIFMTKERLGTLQQKGDEALVAFQMNPYLPIYALVFVLFWICVGWSWFRLRQVFRIDHHWRTVITALGLIFATISTSLSTFLFVHAITRGEYPFYDATELFCIRTGSLSSLLGVIAAMIGKGTLRVAIAALSIVNLVLWFIAGLGQ